MVAMTKTQWIKEQLDKEGKITRNQALKNYISRLASRIYEFKQKGWVFEEKIEEGDYVYIVKEKPAPKPLTLNFS